MVLAALLCLVPAVAISPPALADELKVKVRFNGVDKLDLEDKLETASKLTGEGEEEVETAAAVRHLAENDVSRLEAVMRSEGYYAPKVTFQVSGSGNRYRVDFNIVPGPKFTITDYVITYTNDMKVWRPTSLSGAGIEPEFSPRGEDLAELQKKFLAWLQNNGFPEARVADRRVEAMPATGKATVQVKIDSGPRAVYGETVWSGLDRTEQAYLDRFIPWEQGQLFKLDQLTEFRDSLAKTELFTSVDVRPGITGENGVTPIEVQVTERPPRTIGVGATYSTNVGAGGRVFWEHRNLFGRAERLHIEANVAEIKQFGIISFRRPFPAERGAWFSSIEGGNEDSEAFSGLNLKGTSGLERKFGERWTFSAAVQGEWSNFEDTFGQQDSILGALPLRGLYDATDDLLNPTRNFKIGLLVTPAVGTTDDLFQFTQFELRGSGYVPFDEEARYLAALWARIGATLGAPIEDIPANRRFYAGGAGSVRGYGYQLLSPLDLNGDPVGGRSVLEGGVEFRVKFTKSIGMVTFVEAGSAFIHGYPDFDDEVGVGAGIGARYYTSFGPIRLDFAVPLRKREGVDDDFQIYISLGQAF